MTRLTNHNILSCENFQTQRVLRWRLFWKNMVQNRIYRRKKVILDTFSKTGRDDDTESLVGKNSTPTSDIKEKTG